MSNAQDIALDVPGFQAIFAPDAAWEMQDFALNDSGLAQIRDAFDGEDAPGVQRFVETINATMQGASIKAVVSDQSPISLAWLDHQDRPVVARIFWNTLHPASNMQSGADLASLEEWIETAMGENLNRSIDFVVQNSWDSATDPLKRETDHGWISIGETPGRSMAWGVPPDFVEIVITSQPGCTFIPSRAWFVRQVC